MKRFRLLFALISVSAIPFLYSCETADPVESGKNDETEKPDTPEEDQGNTGRPESAFPETADTYIINGKEYAFGSTALMQIGENISIAGTPEQNHSEVTEIMTEASEYFFAAISPVLMGNTFDPMTESATFTFMSSLKGAFLETVAPGLTSEITDGICIVTHEQEILTLKLRLTLADGTSIGVHLTAEEGKDAPIEVNENEISYGDETKPLRSAFYLEEGNLTYLFFSAANIAYFTELDIAMAYMYMVVPTKLINGTEVELSEISIDSPFRFGMVDNVNPDKCFEIDGISIGDAAGFFCIENPELGIYAVEYEIMVDGVPYYVSFEGECTSAELEPPVEVKENFFTFDKQDFEYDSVELEKGESFWTVHLNMNNGKTAQLTMSENFISQGGTFGFSQDKNMAVIYDGVTYNKANGYTGTISIGLDQEDSSIEVEFTNYAGFDFYYYGTYNLR